MKGRVYLLRNPINNTVFYVGQTVYNLSDRLRNHLSERSDTKKNNIILEIIEQQKIPIIEEIECLDYNEYNIKSLNERELFWINHYMPIGNIAHVVFYAKTCLFCEKAFESKIKRSLYCSDLCRINASKKRNKIQNEKSNASKKNNKKNKCEYCEETMISIYRNKRFCSDKCRVYFNREKSKIKDTPAPIVQSEDPREGTMAFFNKYGVLYKKDMA